MGYRRAWIALLMFCVVIINYMDRVALSVAAKPIAAAFNLSPVAMGYLFSSFLWTYVICLIPIGLVVDRIGAKRMIGGGLFIWSAATVFTGLTWNFTSILFARLVMGMGESTSYPGGARAIRDWIPEGERGMVTTLFNSGSVAGPAIGAVLVGWLVSSFGWRTGFMVLGGIGIFWTIVWMVVFAQPEKVSWLSPREREKILTERHGRDVEHVHVDAEPSSLGYILSRPTIWGLMLSQACIVYNAYLFLTWLPSYLQGVLHLNVMQTGLFTAIPYTLNVILGMALAWLSDRLLTPEGVRAGRRRYFVVTLMILGLSVLAAPAITETVPLMIVMTIILTACNTASGFNLTMANDLAENPRDAARIMSLAVFGGNGCGLLAPIVTGYIVNATGGFEWAFRVAAGLLIGGALISITVVRGRIRPQHAAPQTA